MSLFKVHKLNARGLKLALEIQRIFEDALSMLETVCGQDSREMAIVRTKLQEANFFAKRAMAEKPENQEA